MPTQIRVMTWNIQNLSHTKLAIDTMPDLIARVVTAANVDLLIVLEVTTTAADDAMTTLRTALRLAEQRHGRPGAARSWPRHFLSHPTGEEHYCAFVRDLDRIRPVVPNLPPNDTLTGTQAAPLGDLTKHVFKVWPWADWNKANAHTSRARFSRFPVVETFYEAERRSKKQRTSFAGRNYVGQRGYRLPALMMFMFRGDHLVPFVPLHAAAVQDLNQRNVLACGQLHDSTWLHIAQAYFYRPQSRPKQKPVSRHLAVLNADDKTQRAVAVRELCFTGDYNMDFLQAKEEIKPAEQWKVQYIWLTPTYAGQGSRQPEARPGAAPPTPDPPLPYPPNAAIAANPESDIPEQRLKAAMTTRGTILQDPRYFRPNSSIEPRPYVSHGIDNFFYGGTLLRNAARLAHNDAAEVVNVPARIVPAEAAVSPEDLDVSNVAFHYYPKYSLDRAHNLFLNKNTPLTELDRLIGARLISDHLPIVLQFQIP